MDCRRFSECITPYLDEMLNTEETRLFEEHIKSCLECYSELQAFQEMLSILNDLKEEETPQGFHQDLMGRLKDDVGSPFSGIPRLTYWGKRLGILAAAMVLIFSIKLINDKIFMEKMPSAQSKNDSAAMENEVAMGAKYTTKDMVADSDHSGQQSTFTEASESKQEREQGPSDAIAMTVKADSEEDKDMNRSQMVEEGQGDMGSQIQMAYIGSIQSDKVTVKVQDVCITPDTLKMMAIRNELEIVKSTEDSVILNISGQEQRDILYKELSYMGEVEDIGEEVDTDQVTIIIIQDE